MEMARRRQVLDLDLESKLNDLYEVLPEILPQSIKPSLLHGDLWSGNWSVTNRGEVVMFDPAVYCGHSEVDLAMTELFGGFPQEFYDAYQETLPLDPGYPQRKLIYQLYYVLVHLNLFGAHYSNQATELLDQVLN